MVKEKGELERELAYFGLEGKAREILGELGEKAALSYLKSSHRLLSKVYHPDLNPGNREKAKATQQRLNRMSDIIAEMSDLEIIDALKGADGSGRAKEKGRLPNEKKRILIVEDEFGLQESFRDIFRMEGYDVRVAVNGLQGYQIFHQFEPDLVFTDVVMPEMDGVEMISRIRETHPHIKVIYMSGFFGVKRLKETLNEEIEKYGYPMLAKPFKVSVMLDLVKSCL